MKKHDAILSYAVEAGDKELAHYIHDHLVDKGLDIWFSAKKLKAGAKMSIAQSISTALLNSNAAICIISKKYLEPRWSSVELDTILELKIREGMRVIPVLYNISAEEFRSSYPLLSPYMWVSGSSHEEIADKIFATLTNSVIEKEYSIKYPKQEDVKEENATTDIKESKNVISGSNLTLDGDLQLGDKKSKSNKQQVNNCGDIGKQLNIGKNKGDINL